MRWLLIAAGLTVATVAQAQMVGSRASRDFVAAAAENDDYEQMSAAAALAQSKDPNVRAFATQMITDHDQTTKALQQAVAAAGVASPPMGMNEGQAGMLAALGALSGQAFDHAYWQQQALAHRSALIAEEGYVAGGDNSSLRDLAKASIPVIRQHLDIAAQMAAQRG